jgi:hypothetical protein
MQPNHPRVDVRRKPKFLSYLSLPLGNGGTVTDVSAGGLSFEAIAPVKMHGPIPVLFSLDSATRIQATVELAWLDESGKKGGLRFTEMPEEVREQIRVWASQSVTEAHSRGTSADPAKARSRTDDIQIAETVAAVTVVPSAKTAPISSEIPKRLLYNLEPPIYSAPSYNLSMFPENLASSPEAVGNSDLEVVGSLLSAARERPIAAVGMVVALALLVSIGIFELVALTL